MLHSLPWSSIVETQHNFAFLQPHPESGTNQMHLLPEQQTIAETSSIAPSAGVSVVICCYNSATRLRDTLVHLAAQDCAQISWEVVVVDNNSTDSTAGVAVEVWNELNTNIPLRVVHEQRLGQAEARRTGVKQSMHQYVLFCDDDNHLAPDYIRKSCEILDDNPTLAAVGGHGQPLYEEAPPVWFENCLRFLACCPQSTSDGVMKPAATMYTAGMLARRSALMNLWSSDFQGLLSGRIGTKCLSAGEDSEMSILLTMSGYQLWYSSALAFKHFIPTSRTRWQYIRKLRWATGRANARLLPHKLLALNNQNSIRSIWILQVISSGARAILNMLRGIVDRNSRIESYFFWGRMFELVRRPRLIRNGIRVLQGAGFNSEALTCDRATSI